MNDINIARADLNLLKVFEALYEEGSASRAAIRLHVTQSAVSASLARLRELYGEQLFRRTGRGLAPTPLASQLKPVVTEALNRFRQSLTMVSPQPDGYEGRSVIIGLSDDFEIAIGSRLIKIMAERAPKLRLIFRQTHSQIVSSALMERKIDMAIASGGFSSRALSHEWVGEGEYACLVDPEFHQADEVMDLDRFVASDHVLISSGGFIGIVDEALAAAGLKRNIAASTTHFAALPYLLKGSSAIATIPAHAARAIVAISGLQMLPCPVSLRRYPIEVGWRTTGSFDKIELKVKGAIEECFRQP
ncbi:LysR family transcriptional regulator [Brenneria izadpanahii]|uniref:LysR family transcriptional regulator n=1 Tax=Brenneria izadpanahii TaxID=2722756 RepID=A0ABX7UQC7_9GAMM|nr:LysR family transcriptional regulator [Brenneria izadpanahii]QTF07794.1 LysR family transcriptional regulator [Brenneria izadpanahii]